MRRVPHALVHPALARRDGDAGLGAQPVQRNAHLAGVAAGHAVGEHVHPVSGIAQVQRRLGDADVGLDADEGDLGARGEVGSHAGDEH